MVEAIVRIGEKGQLVIPKLFRDHFGMLPGKKLKVQEVQEGVLIKISDDPLAVFASLAQLARKPNAKTGGIEEEYEERARKAGIKI